MFSDLYIREVKIDPPADATAYPFTLPVVRGNARIVFDNPVTFLIGENGSGKSTLLEAIAVAYGFNPEGGSLNYAFATHDTHSPLHTHLRLVKGVARPREGFYFRAESFYNAKTYLDEIDGSYGARPMHAYSHGESFLLLVRERLRGEGLYLFDEPEAALSPQSQLALLVRLRRLLARRAQCIIATHSPLLLAYPGAAIYQIGDDGALTPTVYEDTSYFAVYKYFLNNHGRFMAEIMGDVEA